MTRTPSRLPSSVPSSPVFIDPSNVLDLAFHGLIEDPTSQIHPRDVSDRPEDFDEAEAEPDVDPVDWTWSPTWETGSHEKDFGDEDAIFGRGL